MNDLHIFVADSFWVLAASVYIVPIIGIVQQYDDLITAMEAHPFAHDILVELHDLVFFFRISWFIDLRTKLSLYLQVFKNQCLFQRLERASFTYLMLLV